MLNRSLVASVGHGLAHLRSTRGSGDSARFERIRAACWSLGADRGGCAAPSREAGAAAGTTVTARRPTKADAWQRGRQRRRPRPHRAASRLAWRAGLAEARARGFRATRSGRRASCSIPTAALPRPAPTPGSYSCRLVTLGRDGKRGAGVREVQALLLLRRGRGRPVHHRQADRQPAPGRPAVGRR